MADEFIDYTEHLCQILHSIGNRAFINQTYIDLVQREKYNFFIQHLFVFHQCLYINDPRINKYKSEIQQLYDSIELHHYTNIDSLEKILNGQTLRLGQITKMNDYDEAKALIKFNQPIFKMFVSQNNNITMDNILSEIETYTSWLYSFSLSTHGDDVAQWERYGGRKDSPCGVCIKIPMKKLRTRIDELKEQLDLDMLEIIPIVYTSDYAPKNPVLNFITKIAILKTDAEMANMKDTSIYSNLALYSSQVKHESFISESEIRLVMRKRGEGEYYLLNVGDFNDLISSIIIGPGADHIKGRVENLLKQHHLDKTVSIEKSKCSLRT